MSFNLTPKRSRLLAKAQPLESLTQDLRSFHSSNMPWSQIIFPKSVKNCQNPKLSQTFSPSSSKLSKSQEPRSLKPDLKMTSKGLVQTNSSNFTRYNSQKYLNEIFAGSIKTEDQNSQEKGKLIKNSEKIKNFSQNLGKNQKFSQTFQDLNSNHLDYHENSEISKTSDQFYVNNSEDIPSFRPESPITERKLVMKSLDGSGKSLKSQKSAPNNFKVSEKISKDFSLVFRKKDSRILEKEKLLDEIRVKEAENVKIMHFFHEVMNKVHGVKIRLASRDSHYSPLAKSMNQNEQKSIFDLKSRVNDDLDKISSLVEKLMSELTEVQDLKKREKDLKRALNEAHELEVTLQTKLEIEKNKAYELANNRIESQRTYDKKDLFFTREKLEFQEKIAELEHEIGKVMKEKENLARTVKDLNLQTEKFSFYARNMEVDLVKAKEQATRYSKDIEILKEKIKSKEINEELLSIKLRNFEENANYETKSINSLTQKISELEEELKSKTSEITELKYKACLPKSAVIDDIQDRNSKLMTRLQEITSIAHEDPTPQSQLVKSQSKEIKKLRISLELLQKENSALILSKQQSVSLETESLANKLEDLESKSKLLEKENLRLRSELLAALDYVESAEKSSINISHSALIQKEKIKQLQRSKDSVLEESINLKQLLEFRDEKVEKLRIEIKELTKENLEKDMNIDKLNNEINRMKSASASQGLELAFQQEKENSFKNQLEDCITEMKQIKLESKKLKEENFKQTQEITRKNYEVQELNETEHKLREQIIEGVSEIQKISKNLKESQEICESQKKLLEIINSEKEELLCKLEEFNALNQKLEVQVVEIKKELKEKNDLLEVYLDQEGKIMAEIEDIESDLKKMPRRNSLKPTEEIKMINEEKFRLKSLLVYKNAQIKMLKEKNSGKVDEEIKRDAKRHKSLVGNKTKKG